ncbi:TRAP-type C4-dicarboxylate transport system, small permease component [Succiniclasticum ruminis]|jgi:TRAP-type C4-dicarboxylate transport system permease small subunit|uniref:TRAP-type C4-dicarboxylate transport system, small permease component n=1 Tax=Succiniclasticum ruminis TaxID=40841 RepID=A0A1G6L371_9FIRM|nr:TRAP transporter small permease [Succiniclasticum ruminis]SDC37770.1 TRAP-type C4-dicarboxylate transport system, small permease component [Succiniclasticum ruminis]
MEENKFSLKSCLANLDLMIAGTVLAILIVLTFAGVIWRYFLGKPFTWLEEVQTACMVWIVFSAAGAAFRMGNHVAIEMIVDLMPKALQKVMTILISVVVVAVLGYLFDKTIGFIQIFLRSGRATSMMKIPFWLIYGIAIPAYIDMIVSYFYSIWKGVKSEAKEAASVNE